MSKLHILFCSSSLLLGVHLRPLHSRTLIRPEVSLCTACFWAFSRSSTGTVRACCWKISERAYRPQIADTQAVSQLRQRSPGLCHRPANTNNEHLSKQTGNGCCAAQAARGFRETGCGPTSRRMYAVLIMALQAETQM